MLSRSAKVLLFLGLFSLTANGETAWTVQLRRVGPIKLGMSLRTVRRVLLDPRAHLVGDEDLVAVAECAYLESKAIPKALGIMFQKGRVVRIDVTGETVRTANGVAVGDSEDKVKKLFPGRITVEAHHYLPEVGHYLTYSPANAADRGYGMVVETERGIVTSFRTGTLAAISLVEGCS